MSNRHRVARNGFTADLIESYQEPDYTLLRWVVGSCTSPPLGTALEMDGYAEFIHTVVRVCHLKNLAKVASLTVTEQAYVKAYS